MLLVLLYLVVQGKSTTSVPTIVGTKRKAASISELKEWTCALCHVHATSEHGLNEHFRGKKHRAKEEELKGSKGGVKNQPAPVPEKIIDQPKIGKKVANNAQNQNQKQTKKPLAVNRPADQSVPKNEVGAAKKGKFTFVCQQCKIKCYNEPTMVAHLSGKKHLTQMKELEASGKGMSTAKVTSFKVSRKGDGAAGGPGKELKIEGESRRTINEEQGAEETRVFRAPRTMVDEEAEVAEALTDEEEQAMEGQMDNDIEPMDGLAEEGSSFFQLHMRREQY
ncbi:hypothetical protein ACLOJK_002662 [Asimina triloba]